jgi:hypothetical protein
VRVVGVAAGRRLAQERAVERGRALVEPTIATGAGERQVERRIHRPQRGSGGQRLARVGLSGAEARDAAAIAGVGLGQPRRRLATPRRGGVERAPLPKRVRLAPAPGFVGVAPRALTVAGAAGERGGEQERAGAASSHLIDYTRRRACYARGMRVAALALLVSTCLLPSLARAAPPAIDVYTMGAGDDLFSAFGHAAICVRDDATPRGRCYNYGTADFTTPLPLTWDFIRGRARFWVSVADAPWMLSYYVETGRAVWRQTLPLSDDEARRIAVALARGSDERNRYYRYHHFDDNCTTRIRDVLDRATGGALSRDRSLGGPTFRQWARDGFAGNLPLLAAVELLLGRSADRHTDSWSALFLPSELRRAVKERLHAPPVLVVPGRPRPPPGATWLGCVAFPALGALLAFLLVVTRKRPRLARLTRIAGGLLLGLVGTILWALAALSTFPELTRNEMLVVFWPTDLLLALAPSLPPRWLTRYANARVVALGLVVLLRLMGVFVQPLWPLLLPLLPLIALGAAATETAARRE